MPDFPTAWSFFLGGHDLEMHEIRRLLAGRPDVEVHDAGLSWGARASAYEAPLRAALAKGRRPVLIELANDLPADGREKLTFIDHHGPDAGRPSALEQVFDLLKLPREEWTFDQTLVAANDRGHTAAMARAGATPEQMRDVRRRDREAQGITAEEEQEGARAANAAERLLGGRLTVVRLPLDRSATVTDVLDAHLGGPGYENLLVLGLTQTHFFGDGRVVQALHMRHPRSWYGGELPARGFWGAPTVVAVEGVVEALEEALEEVRLTKPACDIRVTEFHHQLLWPLLLRGAGDDDERKVDEFLTALDSAGWREEGQNKAAVDSNDGYSEVVYFHPFVRDFLFGDGGNEADKWTLRRLVRKPGKELTQLKVRLRLGEEPICFSVERAEVLLIRPRVLLFVLRLSHVPGATSLTLDTVLRLQNSIRRAYPPYFRDDGTHGEALASFELVGLTAVPERCRLTGPPNEFADEVRPGAEPPMYAHWRALFGKDLVPLRSSAERRGAEKGLFLQQILDDRIPAMSYIAVPDPAEVAQEDLDRLPAFDPPDLTYHLDFRERERDRFCYTRFSHWGTTYYCGGTAFTMLVKAGAPPYLLMHFRRHYTWLGVIGHYQHAALLYFEDELAERARELAGRAQEEELASHAWRRRTRALLQRFLKFRLRSSFTEVSNQIQGKELFALWIERLGTAALYEQVEGTADRMYQVLEDAEAGELARVAEKGLGLTIALAAAAAVLATGQIAGAVVLAPQELQRGGWLVLALSLPAAILLGGGAWCFYRWWARRGD